MFAKKTFFNCKCESNLPLLDQSNVLKFQYTPCSNKAKMSSTGKRSLTVRAVAIDLIIILLAFSNFSSTLAAASNADSLAPVLDLEEPDDYSRYDSDDDSAYNYSRLNDPAHESTFIAPDIDGLNISSTPARVETDLLSLSLEVLNTPNSDGRTALMTAILDLDPYLAIDLIEKGVDVTVCTKEGMNAFQYSISKCFGDMDLVIERLVEMGADVNQVIPFNLSPLMAAIDWNNYEIVTLLVVNGANVDEFNEFYGETAIDRAIKTNSLKILELLIDQGARLRLELHQNSRLSSTIFEYLMRDRTIKMIKLLVEKLNFDLNMADSSGKHCIQHAVEENNLEMTKYLIGKGVNLDVTNYFNWTLLNLMLSRSCFDFAKLLIEAGATVSNSDKRIIAHLSKSDSRWSALNVEPAVEEQADVKFRHT